MKNVIKASAPSETKRDVVMGVAENQSGVKKKRSSKKARGIKKGHRQRKPKLTSSDSTKPIEATGDSLLDANVGPSPENLASSLLAQPKDMLVDSVNNALASEKSRNEKTGKGKLKKIKIRGKRRVLFEQQRVVVDNLVRSAPHRVMWEWFKMQAGEHLRLSDRLSKQWTPDQIFVVEDGSEKSLIPHIKRIVGEDYAADTRTVQADDQKQNSSKRKAAAVACLAIGYDAESAVRLATRVYDGTPVIKLFSRHLEKDDQRNTLRKVPRGFVPTASGTARRIQDLANEGALTLEHTKVVVIDLCRDSLLSNMLENANASRELFTLFRDHVQQFLESGHLSVIVVTQAEEEMPKERFASHKPANDKDMDDVPSDSEAGDTGGK